MNEGDQCSRADTGMKHSGIKRGDRDRRVIRFSVPISCVFGIRSAFTGEVEFSGFDLRVEIDFIFG